MKHLVVVLMTSVTLLSLTACEGDSPSDAQSVDSTTMTYRGQAISCVEAGKSANAQLSCDFETFYAENSSLVEGHGVGVEPDVHWLDVDGKPLACLAVGKGDSRALSCDWHRYHLAKRVVK